jgi:hypothetical protein
MKAAYIAPAVAIMLACGRPPDGHVEASPPDGRQELEASRKGLDRDMSTQNHKASEAARCTKWPKSPGSSSALGNSPR